MSSPWPDIAHSYDVAAEHYAATFATELDGKPFDRDLLGRYAAELAGRGDVWDVGCGAAGHLTRYLADRGAAASGVDISPGSVAVARRCQPAGLPAAQDSKAVDAGDKKGHDDDIQPHLDHPIHASASPPMVPIPAWFAANIRPERPQARRGTGYATAA